MGIIDFDKQLVIGYTLSPKEASFNPYIAMSHSHLLMLTIYVANFPNVKKVTVFVLVFVFVIAFKLVSSCHLIILIKCLGSLFEGTIFAFVFVGQVSSSHIFHGISLPP